MPLADVTLFVVPSFDVTLFVVPSFDVTLFPLPVVVGRLTVSDSITFLVVEKLTFENIDFTYAKDAKPGVAAMMLGCDEAVKQGLIINNAKELILKNVNITGCEGEPVVTGNVDKIIK